jgi:hypothetical protein
MRRSSVLGSRLSCDESSADVPDEGNERSVGLLPFSGDCFRKNRESVAM